MSTLLISPLVGEMSAKPTEGDAWRDRAPGEAAPRAIVALPAPHRFSSIGTQTITLGGRSRSNSIGTALRAGVLQREQTKRIDSIERPMPTTLATS